MPAPLWWRAVCRSCQAIVHVLCTLVPFPKPKVLRGKDSVLGLPQLLQGKRLSRPMLVTDGVIMKLGLADGLLAACRAAGLSVAVYHGVTPNPTLDQVEAAYALYKQERCDCLIGFGGGSAIDCAKLVGVRVVRPRTPLSWMKGICKVLWPLPTLVAVPTTSGTGSEVTVAAVVTNPQSQEKYALEDLFLVPRYAVLDPALTVGMPKPVTSTTGLDALTHGVEAFLNECQYKETTNAATMTVRLVFNNLKKAYDTPTDIVARGNMMEAAYLGGVAFTRAFVGNVHAIAHTLSGFYNVPHGLANAILLPVVLEYYGPAVHAKLARLAGIIGIPKGTDAEKAKAFIAAIRALNAALGIPKTLAETNFRIKEEDIRRMASTALGEANPLYPVPVVFAVEDCVAIIRKIM